MAMADSAAADIAAGSEPVGIVAALLPLAHSRPHAVPGQSLPAPCEIRSCFAPDSALIPEAFWHRTRPILLPEGRPRPLFEHLVPIALVLYHLLKGTDVCFCFRRGGLLIVHGGFGSAGVIGRASPEHQGSRGASDT
jgi:hypothetical protein